MSINVRPDIIFDIKGESKENLLILIYLEYK